MRHVLHFTLCAAYAAVGVTVAADCGAQAVGGIAQVAIIDRDSGAVLSPYFYHGEYWVAGTPGARYAIEIRNRLTERVLAVTSVDGINVVTGATAGWDQGGYVFGPGERYQITGWRKSDAQVAAFTFTDSPNSYAGRTGRPANVGRHRCGGISRTTSSARVLAAGDQPGCPRGARPRAGRRHRAGIERRAGVELGEGCALRGSRGLPAGIGPAAGTYGRPEARHWARRA